MNSTSGGGGGGSINVRMSMGLNGKGVVQSVTTTYNWRGYSIEIEDCAVGEPKEVAMYDCPDELLPAIEHWCQTRYADMGLVEYLTKMFGE